MNRRVFLETLPMLGPVINCSPKLLGGESLSGQVNVRAPEGSNRLPPSVALEVIAWFWMEKPEFEPGGYRKFIDLVADNSNFGMLTTSLRAPKHEITFPETHDQIRRAVQYAHQRGLKVAFDLDVRFARGTFRNRFPDQLQWMLRIRAFPSSSKSSVQAEIKSQYLADHMTWPGSDYQRLSGRLMGVFRSVHEQTQAYPSLEKMQEGYRIVEESPEKVSIEVPVGHWAFGEDLIVAAAFEYEYPDVFSPFLPDFQKDICEQYRDTSLDGGMGADEWGFPPVVNHGGKDGDFWYSKALAERYGKIGGGDFVRDSILMALGIGGTYEQRLIAINRYMHLILTRNLELEQSFYRNAVQVFGPQSFAGTHATWGNMPWGDAFKDGYDWWGATRDYGQTDEHWPIPVRTALAKKMGGSVWYNQFYAPDAEPYSKEVWQDARAGGRVNLHPLWPSSVGEKAYLDIFRSPFMRAESRVRLLNFIKPAPLDCPVAIVFGHAASLNWAGAHFGDLGEGFAAELWNAHGVRADLIPSSEIESGALRLASDGWLVYGVQRYRVLVFLNPDFEGPETFDFLRRVASSQTHVFVRDETRLAPNGHIQAWEDVIEGAAVNPTPAGVAEFLQTWSSPRHLSPPDLVRLTDGTHLLARGEKNPSGDTIDETFYIYYANGLAKVKAGVTGLLAIRLSEVGEVQALAASDLRHLQIWKVDPFSELTEQFHLEPPVPIDVALWRDENGKQHGIVQGAKEIPQELLQWTRDWVRMDLAPPNGPKR
jgi:hypothetical protein